MKLTVSDLANCAEIFSIPLTIIVWLVTKERFAKFWRKWLKFILSGFGVVALIGLWRNGWLSWLSFPVTWPVWALILLAFAGLAIACLALAVFYFVTKEASHLNKETSHLDYFSDDIFGVEWNWRYIRDQLDERELSAFCPNKQCACRLEPQLRSGAGAVDVVLLVCGHCGFSKGFEYDWRQLRRKVIIEIERRVRTREFKQRLEAHG